jgi:putative Mg2+ transporter-C (MgtC) family protein
MIAVGSTLLTLTSIHIAGAAGDPGRIAAQIVSGVGFIGAGTIIQARGAVVGLTTAATIWAVAGIGIAVGAGQTMLATGATLVMIVCLTVLGRLDLSSVGRRDLTTFTIVAADVEDPASLLEIFSTNEVAVEHSALHKTPLGTELSVVGNLTRKQTERTLADLSAREGVRSVSIDV